MYKSLGPVEAVHCVLEKECLSLLGFLAKLTGRSVWLETDSVYIHYRK